MIPTDPITATITAGAASAYLLQLVQKAKTIPWITEHTTGINYTIRGALSLISTVGITHVWNPSSSGGGILMLTIPSFSVVAVGVWHWFGQFAVMHGFGQLLDIKPQPKP